jgi:hypothetical protein
VAMRTTSATSSSRVPGRPGRLFNEGPLSGDQLSVPAKQCLGCDDRAKLVQRLAPERPRLLGKLAALGVSEHDAPSTKALPQHAILGFQVIDRRRLLPLKPTRD